MNPALSNPLLTQDVISKRAVALAIDIVVIAIIWLFLGAFFGVFGLLTFGLGWHLLGLLPVVPFLYHFATLAKFGRTPGQGIVGLSVKRIEDLGPPTVAQALACTLAFYVTLALSGILLLVAFVTEGHRTLHDMIAGLVVVRTDALAGVPMYDLGGGSYRT